MHFLPGLVKMMEERLGWAGRPLTTAMMLLIVLAVILFCARFLYTVALDPVLAWTRADSGLLAAFATMVAFSAVGATAVTVYHYYLQRRRSKLLTDLDERIELLRFLLAIPPEGLTGQPHERADANRPQLSKDATKGTESPG